MKIVELTAIAARVFAICLFLYSLQQLASLAGYIGPVSSEELRVPFIYYLAVTLVPLIIAAIIWFFPVTISSAFLPKIQSKEIKVSEGNTFLPAAFIALGVYVLTYAIPDFLFHATRFYMIQRMKSTGMGYEIDIDSIANFVATILELIIGFWLILGQAGMLKLIAKVRGRAVYGLES